MARDSTIVEWFFLTSVAMRRDDIGRPTSSRSAASIEIARARSAGVRPSRWMFSTILRTKARSLSTTLMTGRRRWNDASSATSGCGSGCTAPGCLAVRVALGLDPPAEHGAVISISHLARGLSRWPPLGVPQQPDLAGLRIGEDVVWVPLGIHRTECRAIYRVPTVNLDTAAAETRRGARASSAGRS